jgi:hypothetical protein
MKDQNLALQIDLNGGRIGGNNEWQWLTNMSVPKIYLSLDPHPVT